MNLLCRSSHINIIDIYQHGVLQPPHTFYYIDMDLCDINLEQYIYSLKRGIHGLMDWSLAVEAGEGLFLICAIMQQLLSGLKFIHGHNEAHRDLNPQNGGFSEILANVF